MTETHAQLLRMISAFQLLVLDTADPELAWKPDSLYVNLERTLREMGNLVQEMKNEAGPPDDRSPATREWQAWQKICRQLAKLGAVTEDDLLSSINRADTEGERLLRDIREWGEALVESRKARLG